MLKNTVSEPTCNTQSHFRFLPYCIITAEVVIFLILETVLGYKDISRDGFGYMLYTETALQHGWAAAAARFSSMPNYPPLLVMTMYFAGKLGLDYQICALTVNMLSIIFCSWGVLYCCRILYRDKICALCSAMIVMSMPKLYLEGCDILRDPVYWALMVWSVALVLNMNSSEGNGVSKKYFLQITTLGILLGMCCISRKEGFFTLPLMMLALLLFNKQSIKHKLWSLPLVVVLAAAVISLPWLLGVPWNPLKMFSLFERT